MTDLPPFDDADLFDEAGYLRLYPGIAEAMMLGIVDTAWNHFVNHGRAEGRLANDVDPDFYLAAYPEVERDFGHTPSSGDAAPHYITLGRARGYRPNAGAPRVANGAAHISPFGGLWTDQAHALDLIQGRLDLGRIRRRDAAMLRTFALDGIVELDHGFDQEQVREASLVVDQAFTGMFPDLLFAPGHQAAQPRSWQPDLTEQNVAALDPHIVSRAMRDLLLDSAVTSFLSLLFDAPPRLTASRAFLRAASPPERDVAWFAHSLPLQFVAVTFDLEANDSGPSVVWPGSHRLPDLPWGGEHVTWTETRRTGAAALEQEMAGREDRVRGLLHHQAPRQLDCGLGLRMIRHANLIHGVVAPEPPAQRRSVTAWYCPSHVVPGYFEVARTGVHAHNGFAFSSGVYPALEPRD